jgi:hypothetical protein
MSFLVPVGKKHPRARGSTALSLDERFPFVARFRDLSCALGLLLLLACGCSSGPKLIKPTGELLYNQKPLRLSEDASVTMRFTLLDETPPRSFAATVNRDDSTFVVPGNDGNGIPPGKYRISVNQKMIDLTPEAEQINEMFSRNKTQIEREVTNEEPIILDLSKPTG